MLTDTTALSEAFVDRGRQALIVEQARIDAEIAGIDTDLAQLNDPGGTFDIDFGEEGGEGGGVQLERDREIAVRAQLRDRRDDVDLALRRIGRQTYGLCETCHQPIGEGRLEAWPTATECMPCKAVPWMKRRL
jgi:DnaK suppressor protein